MALPESNVSPEALKMLKKYPDRRPVICVKAPGWGCGPEAGAIADLPAQKKFLVPSSMRCDGLKDTIAKHVKDTVQLVVSPEGIELTVEGAPLEADNILEAYDQHKAADGFLYICFKVRDAATGSGSSPSGEIDLSDSSLSKEAKKLLSRHPGNVPVICDRASSSTAPALAKNKFLVPYGMVCDQFKSTVLENMKSCLDPSDSSLADASASCIQLSCSDISLGGEQVMKDIYNDHRGSDGFLYMVYDLQLSSPEPSCEESDERQEVAEAPEDAGETSPQHEQDDEGKLEEEEAEGPLFAPCKDQDDPQKEEEPFFAPCDDVDEPAEDLDPGHNGGSNSPEQEEMQDEKEQQLEEEDVASSVPEEACPAAEPAAAEPACDFTPASDVEASPCEEKCSKEVEASEEESPQPLPETGGTSSGQSYVGPAACSSGAISIHLPDNDPDDPDTLDVSAAVSAAPMPSSSSRRQATSTAPVARRPELDHRAKVPATASGAQAYPATKSSSSFSSPQKPAASEIDDVNALLTKFPGRIPVICKRGRNDVPEISRSKFLVPGTMRCSEFKYMIHRQLRHGNDIGFSETIYLFLDNVSPKTGATMSELYSRYKKDDHYLHMTYSLENTLG